jgi:hypothetical protein
VQPLAISCRLDAGSADSTCAAPPAQICSHGIHLSKRPDGRMAAPVVNHAQRESIEALDLVHSEATGQPVASEWDFCFDACDQKSKAS